MCNVFLLVVYIGISVGEQIIKRVVVMMSLTGWSPQQPLLCLSYVRTSIINIICRGLLYIQWFEVRNDCWFCRYWWNCWPSLLKLSSDSKMFILIFYGSLIVKTSHFLLFTPRRPRKTRNIYSIHGKWVNDCCLTPSDHFTAICSHSMTCFVLYKHDYFWILWYLQYCCRIMLHMTIFRLLEFFMTRK